MLHLFQVADGHRPPKEGAAGRDGAVVVSLAGVLVLLLISGVCGMAALIGIGAVIGQVVAETFHLPMIVVLQVDGREFPLAWSLAWAGLLGALLLALARPARV